MSGSVSSNVLALRKSSALVQEIWQAGCQPLTFLTAARHITNLTTNTMTKKIQTISGGWLIAEKNCGDFFAGFYSAKYELIRPASIGEWLHATTDWIPPTKSCSIKDQKIVGSIPLVAYQNEEIGPWHEGKDLTIFYQEMELLSQV